MRQHWVLAITTSLLVGRAFAQAANTNANTNATLQSIEHARQSVHTIEAQFDEDRRMGLFAQTLHASGRLVLEAPNHVRWEIDNPNPGVFIVDGARVAYHSGSSTASANQNQVGPLGAVLGDLAAFLSGSLQSLQSRYTITTHNGANGSVVIEATPLDPEVHGVVSHMQLTFASNLQAIEEVVMTEPSGDDTTIHLHNTVINSGHVTAAAFRP